MSDLDGEALRRARIAAGFTQTQLAVALGVGSPGRISMWELGQANPMPRHLSRIAEVLDVPIEDLFIADTKDLRRLRREAGLTLLELAERIHVAEPTVRRWEHGSVAGVLDRAPIASLADVLGVDVQTVRTALTAAREYNE